MEITTLCLASGTPIKWQYSLSSDNGCLYSMVRTANRMESTLFFLWLQFCDRKWQSGELSRYTFSEQGKECYCVRHQIFGSKRQISEKDTREIVELLQEFISSKRYRYSNGLRSTSADLGNERE